MYLVPDFTSNSGAKDGVSSLTWNHTCNGVGRILVVGVGSLANINSVTYAGLPLTNINGAVGGESSRSSLWYLKNPPVGTASIVVSFASGGRCAGAGISFVGADQLIPIHASNTENGTSNPSVSLTTTIPNTYVVDVLYHSQTSPNPSAGGGQVVFMSVNPGSGDFAGASYKAWASYGAVSMSWVRTGAHAYCAVAILETQPQGSFLMNFV